MKRRTVAKASFTVDLPPNLRTGWLEKTKGITARIGARAREGDQDDIIAKGA